VGTGFVVEKLIVTLMISPQSSLSSGCTLGGPFAVVLVTGVGHPRDEQVESLIDKTRCEVGKM
jgi:hypothetical protein